MRHAGVKVPPPIIQLSFVGVGRALEAVVPFTQVPEAWLLHSRILGVLIIRGWIIPQQWGVVFFHPDRGIPS